MTKKTTRLILMARFLWNMVQPQLHLLSFTVKNSDVLGFVVHNMHKKLQYKGTPSFGFSQTNFQNESLL